MSKSPRLNEPELVPEEGRIPTFNRLTNHVNNLSYIARVRESRTV
jgi:hypothetical protein